MKVLFLVWSALSVSADSFFAGLSLSNKNTSYKSILLGVSSTVFILAFLGSALGYLLSENFKTIAIFISGAVLSIIAVNELIKTNEVLPLWSTSDETLKLSIISGASIGVDGAIGCFSLVVEGFSPIYVTLLITATHLLLLSVSFIVSKKLSEFKKLEKLPAFLVLSLGLYKIITCFL